MPLMTAATANPRRFVCINKLLAANITITQRGARMGLPPQFDEPPADTGKLYLQRARWVDGDYTPDGTYWGRSPNDGDMWFAFSATGSVLVPMRASSRAEAFDVFRAECERHCPGVPYRVHGFAAPVTQGVVVPYAPHQPPIQQTTTYAPTC